MAKILFIAFGGALGALLRYFISGIPYKFTDTVFPVGTMVVNLLGAFLIGFLWAFFERVIIPVNYSSFIFIGIVGAFTTFSTFCLETMNLFRDGEVKLALLNIFLSNLFGIFLVLVGFISAKYVLIFLKGR